MTGVYERALGAAADDLHPEVRERYAIGPDDDALCVGTGELTVSRGTHVLPLLYAMTGQDMLFPETGHDVPVTVTTVGLRTDAGHEALTTRRAFEFGSRTRVFTSLTVWDDANDRLLDFLGRNGLVVSELHPSVDHGALVVEAGRSWARAGDRYVRLPGPLGADVTVRDRYDPGDERFHVTAVVENALAGHVLSYLGAFTQERRAVAAVPDDLRPESVTAPLPPR